MAIPLLNEYKRKIESKFKAGNATEHTHRAALQVLMESLEKGISAVNEPKRIECGAPDFIITREDIPLGYIEAKDIGKSLDEVERSEQMDRYLESLNNLILTDYLEFRWYVDGQYRMSARLAKPITGGKLVKEKDGAERVLELLKAFLREEVKSVGSPRELADRMASLARLIHDIIRQALKDDDKGGTLRGQLDSFRKVLLHDLTEDQFADMYAQTICYGLFTSRCNFTGKKFSRDVAVRSLPKTNPFLRGLFNYIAGADLDDRIAWAVDNLAEFLHRAEIGEILRTFGKRSRREDPIVHFYETFLASYDPKLRESRGVYYTPEPVVSYIVRSVDYVLKNDFKLTEGLADRSKVAKKMGDYHKVMILDPAVGTGTFLHGVVDHIHEQVTQKQAGAWKSYVSDHLLPRLFGFELLMAPYAVAHMKLGLQLAETGYDIDNSDRLRIYLTNTLEEAHDLSGLPLFTQWIANEVNEASEVKTNSPVMVVLGNPPYSGHSANKGDWIHNLMRGKDLYDNGAKTANYFECDGKPLGERNPKWLNDDYVKFIRFAQWRIEQTGYGVLAFISNHGYLDNPTFRGMRQALMETFDDIYVLDLHGNSKKKETCPDGSKDENVFDIQQGVAIGIFVKRQRSKEKPANVYHSDLFGLREIMEKAKGEKPILVGGKYLWLWENQLNSTKWTKIHPQKPFYLFVPQDTRLLKEYEQGMKITDIMPINSVGIATARDKLTIHWTKDQCWKTVKEFMSLEKEEAREQFKLGKDVRDWKIAFAQDDLESSGPSRKHLTKVLYRPFDYRYTYYTGKTRGFLCMPRPQVMHHMLVDENIGLITSRLTKGEDFHHVQLTENISEVICMSSKTSNNGFLFPLYEYPEKIMGKKVSRKPNLDKKFIKNIEEMLDLKFISEMVGSKKDTVCTIEIFSYITSILYSPSYQKRYKGFLKGDFPRIPITSSKVLFRQLSELGQELIDVQLMRSGLSSDVKYPVEGDNEVEKPRYQEPKKGSDGRVWINKTQFFEGVRPDVWEYLIGGYQVCEKWLKDRKKRTLSYDEIEHYRNIIAAVEETIRLQVEIDKAIEKHGGWPIS